MEIVYITLSSKEDRCAERNTSTSVTASQSSHTSQVWNHLFIAHTHTHTHTHTHGWFGEGGVRRDKGRE